ncbi:MAG: nitrate/nitrite transporter [Pseudorhodoplanes sp.]|uniref:MFS transporter n=1 Tax=Pseudorhodoplanes sp. TaxID=1934341 RepID=UPI003D1382A1
MAAFRQQTEAQDPASNTGHQSGPHDDAIDRRSFVPAWTRASQPIEALAQNWRLIACVFLPFAAGFYLSYLFRNINAVIAGPLTAELGLDAGQFGLLTSVYFLTFAAAQLPVGILLDRYGPRRVQSSLFVVAACGAALFALSESFLPLVLSRALIGLGVAAALAAGLKAIVLWFPKERLPLANGWMIMLGALGAVTATTPVEALLASIGWRELFLFLAAITAACALTIYLVVPDAPSAEPAVNKETVPGLRTVFTDRRFWRLAPLSATSIGTAWALQGLWAAAWLTDVERFDRALLVRHLLVMAVALCLGALLIGWAADRLRNRGISLRTLLGSLAALFIAAQLALIFRCFSSSYLLWAMIAAVGSGTVLSFAILAEYFPKELTGRANAALNVFHMGGAFALQCLTGFVIQAWAKDHGHYPEVAYQTAFAINLLLQIIALVWFSLPRQQSLTSAIRARRYSVTSASESVVRFGMKKHTTPNLAPHPQTPFMRCLTCGSIRPLGDRLMPMVARPAV